MCVFVLSSSKFSAKKGNERCAYIVSITEANISSFGRLWRRKREQKNRAHFLLDWSNYTLRTIYYNIILYKNDDDDDNVIHFLCLPACVCVYLPGWLAHAHCERAINDRTLTYYFLHVMTGVQARNFSQNVQGMHKKWVNLFRRYWYTKVSLARFIESCFSKAKSLSLCISNIVEHDDKNRSIIWLHAKIGTKKHFVLS